MGDNGCQLRCHIWVGSMGGGINVVGKEIITRIKWDQVSCVRVRGVECFWEVESLQKFEEVMRESRIDTNDDKYPELVDYNAYVEILAQRVYQVPKWFNEIYTTYESCLYLLMRTKIT